MAHMYVTIFKGGMPKIEDSFSNRDAKGKDVPGVPRYPRSVRISSVQMGKLKNASYKTSDRKEDILYYFEKTMGRHGWKKFEISEKARKQAASTPGPAAQLIAGDAFLLFQDKENMCAIGVVESPEGVNENIIGVVHFPKI